jgi:hypothetical protein
LIWVLPLVAIVEGLTWRWLLICALTSAIYPFLYVSNLMSFGATNAGTYGPLFAGMIVLRNGVMIYALAMVVRPRTGSPSGTLFDQLDQREKRLNGGTATL